MSRTDNTRRFDIQMMDPSIPTRIIRRFFRDIDTGESIVVEIIDPHYCGGSNGFKGHGKPCRKDMRRATRAYERQSLNRIKRMTDVDDADLPMIRDEKRCLKWVMD